MQDVKSDLEKQKKEIKRLKSLLKEFTENEDLETYRQYKRKYEMQSKEYATVINEYKSLNIKLAKDLGVKSDLKLATKRTETEAK